MKYFHKYSPFLEPHDNREHCDRLHLDIRKHIHHHGQHNDNHLHMDYLHKNQSVKF